MGWHDCEWSEQFGLKPKAWKHVSYPYPVLWQNVIAKPIKDSDFSKFSRQDNVSTYKHIAWFLAQYGEASWRLWGLGCSHCHYLDRLSFGFLHYLAIREDGPIWKSNFIDIFQWGSRDEVVGFDINQRSLMNRFELYSEVRDMRKRCSDLNLTNSQAGWFGFIRDAWADKERFYARTLRPWLVWFEGIGSWQKF